MAISDKESCMLSQQIVSTKSSDELPSYLAGHGATLDAFSVKTHFSLAYASVLPGQCISASSSHRKQWLWLTSPARCVFCVPFVYLLILCIPHPEAVCCGDPASSIAGLCDLIRIISRPDKAPQDEEGEILGDDEEDEEDEEEERLEEDQDSEESDAEMDDSLTLGGEVDEEAERPANMDIDNGVTSTSDRVRPPNE